MKKTTALRGGRTGFADVRTVRKLAAIMLPVYRTVAVDRRYARSFSKAVAAADLKRIERLLGAVSPGTAGLPVAANGIGYFVSYPLARGGGLLTNGTTIPPGTAHFLFGTRAHRAVARALLPLYRELAGNPCFAAAFVKAVGGRQGEVVRKMIRGAVRSPALRSVDVGVEDGGVALLFRFRFSKYRYRNLLFRERV